MPRAPCTSIAYIFEHVFGSRTRTRKRNKTRAHSHTHPLESMSLRRRGYVVGDDDNEMAFISSCFVPLNRITGDMDPLGIHAYYAHNMQQESARSDAHTSARARGRIFALICSRNECNCVFQ